MFDEKAFWVKVLHRALDDAEIRQTLVISETESSAFRIVQEFELQRDRIGGKLTLIKSSASYSQDSLYKTIDLAIAQAERLVDKYYNDGWRLSQPQLADGEEIGPAVAGRPDV